MILEDLEPMTDQECQAVSVVILLNFNGCRVSGDSTIPVIKNLWNSVSGSIKLSYQVVLKVNETVLKMIVKI